MFWSDVDEAKFSLREKQDCRLVVDLVQEERAKDSESEEVRYYNRVRIGTVVSADSLRGWQEAYSFEEGVEDYTIMEMLKNIYVDECNLKRNE
jgi:hypothetical protein